MKINELHLRNIASIEKADIDFVNDPGLKDPDTGRAAQMFLIYGDTGTGKSVLLDGIAMALYGKTPRIEDVENKKCNSFTNAYGNEMSITSIEQYTRLGISENDECYSEVAFVGNDDVEYRAKMQLGLSKSKGQLKSKKRWFLKVGNDDWIEGQQCGKIIENAVGLTFDQFNRMAMLAQGQFANFLCGSREERADILERITQTGVFSDYGKAIRNIYDRRKNATLKASVDLQTAESYILPDDEVQRLQSLVENESERGVKAREMIKSLNVRINLVTKILDSLLRKDEASARLSELETEAVSDKYTAIVRLCRDWDATDNERRIMSELTAKRKTLDDALSSEQKLKLHYASLAADLVLRERKYADESASLSADKEWLDERKDRDELYSQAQLILSQIQHYRRNCKALDLQLKEKNAAVERIDVLHDEYQKAEDRHKQAEREVEAAQNEVDALLKQINELNPKQMDADSQRLASLKTAYDKLLGDYSEWIKQKKEKEDQVAILNSLNLELSEKQRLKAEAEKTFNLAQAAYEKAMRRLAAIDASLDEKLDELRQMIVKEQTDICPLCGQKIVNAILTKDQFAALVTPYEEERQQTRAEVERRQKELEDAGNAVSNTEGRIKELEQMQLKLDKTIDDGYKNLSARMEKAGVPIDGDVKGSIDAHLKDIALREGELQTKRELLNGLQQQVEVKLKAKKPLDDALHKTTELLATAAGNVKQNKDRIDVLTKETEKARLDLDAEQKQIDDRLSLWFADWEEHIDDAVDKLDKESALYLSKKHEYEQSLVRQSRQRDLLDNISAIDNRIRAAHSDWNASECASSLIGDPIKEWTELAAQSSSLSGIVDDCRQTIVRCMNEISDWKTKSGKDEAYLTELMGKRGEVATARGIIVDHDSNVKIWQKSFDDAVIAAAEARKALNLSDDDAVPNKEELENQLAKADADERESNRLCAEARTKLDANEKMLDKLRETKAVYEKAKKESDHWYLLDKRFGENRLRNLVQTHILMPLLKNANQYLSRITDRYTLTCTTENEQLSILVLDRFNRGEMRSAAVLSGGEKFMISLALSLALSSLNRPDLNVNILFIDEGFGTLDQEFLNSVLNTLGRLGELSGQGERRVGIISHREELLGCIPNKIKLRRIGEGRSKVEIVYEP